MRITALIGFHLLLSSEVLSQERKELVSREEASNTVVIGKLRAVRFNGKALDSEAILLLRSETGKCEFEVDVIDVIKSPNVFSFLIVTGESGIRECRVLGSIARSPRRVVVFGNSDYSRGVPRLFPTIAIHRSVMQLRRGRSGTTDCQWCTSPMERLIESLLYPVDCCETDDSKYDYRDGFGHLLDFIGTARLISWINKGISHRLPSAKSTTTTELALSEGLCVLAALAEARPNGNERQRAVALQLEWRASGGKINAGQIYSWNVSLDDAEKIQKRGQRVPAMLLEYLQVLSCVDVRDVRVRARSLLRNELHVEAECPYCAAK